MVQLDETIIKISADVNFVVCFLALKELILFIRGRRNTIEEDVFCMLRLAQSFFVV